MCSRSRYLLTEQWEMNSRACQCLGVSLPICVRPDSFQDLCENSVSSVAVGPFAAKISQLILGGPTLSMEGSTHDIRDLGVEQSAARYIRVFTIPYESNQRLERQYQVRKPRGSNLGCAATFVRRSDDKFVIYGKLLRALLATDDNQCAEQVACPMKGMLEHFLLAPTLSFLGARMNRRF